MPSGARHCGNDVVGRIAEAGQLAAIADAFGRTVMDHERA